MSAAVLDPREEPGFGPAAALSALTHLLLFAVLVFGVRWQSRPPEVVEVELWEPPPAPRVEAPKPAPVVEPEPAKPEPKIEKPEIAVKAPPKPEAKPKPVPKPAPPRTDDTQRRMREELAREQNKLAMADQAQRDLEAARNRALDTWIDKVKAKIRGNIVLPPDLQGNPEAVFDVVQLSATGDVLSAKLRKSSGHKGYDDALERAILKSSPLPRPERAELSSRELRLTFHPKD